MATISRELFQKLFLLFFLGKNPHGVYGEFRLNKLFFHFEKTSKVKPFSIKHYHYGAYSEELVKCKDLLLQTNHIITKNVGTTLAYIPNVSVEMMNVIVKIMQSVPELEETTNSFLNKYNRKRDAELKNEMYNSDDFKTTTFNQIIFSSNLPAKIEVGVDEQITEDLSLGLDPNFLQALEGRLQYARQHPTREWRSVLSAL